MGSIRIRTNIKITKRSRLKFARVLQERAKQIRLEAGDPDKVVTVYDVLKRASKASSSKDVG